MSNPDIPAKPAASYHHGDLRQTLIDAAAASIETHGVDALSLAALAKAAGVSQGAPYRHFADRQALLAAVAAKGFNDFIEQLGRAVGASRKGTPLSRMANAYVAFGTQHAGLYQLMFASPVLKEAAPDAELSVVARKSFQMLVDTLTHISNAQKRRRQALHIWVALHGVVMLSNQRLLEGGPVSLNELMESIVAV